MRTLYAPIFDIPFVVDSLRVKKPKGFCHFNELILPSLFQVLHIIDDTTDIIYSVAAEAAGGIVSSRY